MKLTDYNIYDKHITERAKRLTESDIEARKKAQATLMNEDAFAIILDGSGKTEYIVPRYFDGENVLHLQAYAMSEFMEILSCTGCTRKFLGLDSGGGSCSSDGDSNSERSGTTH